MFEKLRAMEKKFNELNKLMSDPAVIAERSTYQKYAKEYAELEPIVEKFRQYKDLLKEIEETRSLIEGSKKDLELRQLATEEMQSLEKKKEQIENELKQLLLPVDPLDNKNVILEIRAGTGGDEATLFAQNLFRMYLKFAEAKGWKVEMLDVHATDIGGIKEAVVIIEGKGAYSLLKYESGVHRVQRVPVTESSGRIHTSAATVAVLPEAEEVEVDIDEKDIRIDRFCSSGPGGQSVNTTYSAIRVTHMATGLIVSCQDEKSQHKNLAKAMRVLRSRLYDLALEEQQESIASNRKKMVGSGDRSEKIRTYNFPQGRVTDHRINLTLHKLEEILNGELDPLIEALIAHYRAEGLKAAENAKLNS
jgi:peptide chain release factor 1